MILNRSLSTLTLALGLALHVAAQSGAPNLQGDGIEGFEASWRDKLSVLTDIEISALIENNAVEPQHQLPLKNVRALSNNPLTLLNLGDSLNRSLLNRPVFSDRYHAGWKMFIQEYGINITANASSIVNSDKWLTGEVRRQVASSTVEWQFNSNTPVYGNRIGVGYIPDPAAGSFTVQYSIDGGTTFEDETTVDASASTQAFEFLELNPNNGRPQEMVVRIVTDSGGSVDFAGVGVFRNNNGSYTEITGAVGGRNTRLLATLPANTIENIFSELGINMVLFGANESASMYDQDQELDQLLARIPNTVDFVLHTPNVGGGEVAQSHSDIRDAMIAHARRTDGNVIDVWPFFVDFDYAVANDLMVANDEVHAFGANGFDYIAQIIRHALSSETLAGSALATNKGSILFSESGTNTNVNLFSSLPSTGSIGTIHIPFGENGRFIFQTNNAQTSYNAELAFNGNPYDPASGGAGEVRLGFNSSENNSNNIQTGMLWSYEGVAENDMLVEASSWPRAIEIRRQNNNGALDIPSNSLTASMQTRRYDNDNAKLELVGVFPGGEIVPYASIDGRIKPTTPTYADDAAADADADLLSGQYYKVGREVRQKP